MELHQTAESFWKRVSGNFDSGLIYTKGNDTTQYNLGVGLRLRRERWNGETGFNSTLSKNAGVSASTRNESWLQAERLVGRKRWFYAGAARFLESAQQGINLQTTLGGGVGRYIKDSNSARICVFRSNLIGIPGRWRSRFRNESDHRSGMKAITIPG